MNELQMVRELFDDPSAPAAHVIAEARARMTEPVPPARARRRRPPLGLGLGLGLVAAGAAAAVAIAATVQGAPSSPVPAPSQQRLSARQILLAAADRAAKEPVGRYWRTRAIQEAVSYRVGSGDGAYVVSRRSESDWWRSRSDSDPDVEYFRNLGTSPATAEDGKAWRRAGSPRRWRVRGEDGHRFVVTPGAGPWQTLRTTPAEKRRRAALEKKVCAASKQCAGSGKRGFKDLSWQERERLAADPARLRELVFPQRAKARASGVDLSSRPADDLMAGRQVLTGEPASPKVRAAVFTLLADLPDVRQIGTVEDMRGRAGIGLAARGTPLGGPDTDTVFDYQLILDPTTYRILGEQRVVIRPGGLYPGMKPGTVVERSAFQGPEWTDEAPHHD